MDISLSVKGIIVYEGMSLRCLMCDNIIGRSFPVW